jgi:enoyl-CoA hydratase/carnithine racemase
MAGNIELQKHGAVATVTINNPARFNAMSRSMWRDLQSIFQQIHADGGLLAVVIRGQGHFCAGGDISEYAGFRFQEDSLRDFHENDVWSGLQAMLDCDVPIIAQIDGNCMGAGVEIASCCDIRVASEAARFGAPIAKLGFPMAPREAALVMRAVGELTAREMLLSAAVLDAPEMRQRGFLNQVVAADLLESAVAAYTERMVRLNLFAALRAAFPSKLDGVAIETDNGLFYSWRDLDCATAMMANLLVSLKLPATGARACGAGGEVGRSDDAVPGHAARRFVFLPLNTAYQSAEIEYFIGNAEPAVVVCSGRTSAGSARSPSRPARATCSRWATTAPAACWSAPRTAATSTRRSPLQRR